MGLTYCFFPSNTLCLETNNSFACCIIMNIVIEFVMMLAQLFLNRCYHHHIAEGTILCGYCERQYDMSIMPWDDKAKLK
jgi:hypothetical protein